jgi:hypothetical protein
VSAGPAAGMLLLLLLLALLGVLLLLLLLPLLLLLLGRLRLRRLQRCVQMAMCSTGRRECGLDRCSLCNRCMHRITELGSRCRRALDATRRPHRAGCIAVPQPLGAPPPASTAVTAMHHAELVCAPAASAPTRYCCMHTSIRAKAYPWPDEEPGAGHA